MEVNDKFRCYNCGKQFKDTYYLERHKKRKTPCLIREIDEKDRHNPLRCIYCNKVFSKLNNLNQHHNRCKVKNGGLQTLHDKVKHEEQVRIKLEEQEIKNKDIEVMFSIMKAEIEDLRAQVKAQAVVHAAPIVPTAITNGTGTVAIGTNTINNINNTINLNITINNYNNPNLEYIKNDVEKFKKLLKYEMAATPIALVEWVWYNRDHPENTSAHLVNKKTGEVLVSLDGRWVTDNVSNVIPKLRQIAYELTEYMFRNNKDSLLTFATDHVPAILARNLTDEKVMKMDEEDILQKMITGRDVSQAAVDGKLLL